MKKMIPAMLLAALCMQAHALYITVNSPNGGETLARGEALTVNWVDNVSENVKIELLKNGTAVQTIANSTESDGSYQWQLPYDLAAGNDYKVKITSTLLASLTDQSNDPFTVKQGSVNLTYPAGGEALAKGSACNIVWNDDLNENVKIELFKNNSLDRVIASSTESDGSFLWQVPSTGIEAAGGYQVRISSTVTNLVTDQSGSFSITGGYIEGNVSGFWPKSGSPYIIGADVTVPANQTLTIEPGSEVLFNAPAQFTVKGRLLAQGTKDEKIRFAPQDTSKYWYGLNFERSDADTSKVEYSEITGVKNDTWVNNEWPSENPSVNIHYLLDLIQPVLLNSGIVAISHYIDFSSRKLIKINCNNGNLIWTKDFSNPSSVIATNDNNILVASIRYGGSLTFTKIDSSGNLIWEKQHSSSGTILSMIKSRQQTYYGLLLVGNSTLSILEIDESGNIVSTTPFTNLNNINLAYNSKVVIGMLNNGNFVLQFDSSTIYGSKRTILLNSNGVFLNEVSISSFSASDLVFSNGNNIFYLSGVENSKGTLYKIIVANNTYECVKIYTDTSTTPTYSSSDFIVKILNNSGNFMAIRRIGYSNYVKEITIDGQLLNTFTYPKCQDPHFAGEYVTGIIQSTSDSYFGLGYWDHGGALTNAKIVKFTMSGIDFSPIKVNHNKLIIQNTYFKNNKSPILNLNNSALSFTNNFISKTSQKIFQLNHSSPIIANNTFVNNTADNGTILYCDSASSPVFLNNICYNNTATNGSTIYLNDATSDPNFLYNNLPGGLSSISGAGSGANFSGQFIENMDINPQFIGSDDFSLKATSPCINAGYPGLDSSAFAQFGLPWSDLAGNPRLYNNRIDLGAYEFISDVRTVSGNITENVNWYEDTVKVTGNVTIASGVKVLINRETVVQFQGRYGFTVNGKIKANGNASQPVIFEAKNPAVGWNGLYYPENSDQDSSFYYNCNFKHALADDGTTAVSFEDNGGLFRIKKGNKVVVSDCEIEDIEAKNNGGAIWIDEASVQIVNCLFHHNKAGNQGGAIYAQNCNPLLLNNTLVYNQAANGGSALALQNSDAVNYNNIVWFNTSNNGKQIQLNDNNSDPNFKFCNIESGLSALSGTGSGENFSGAWQDNISGNPDFSGAKSANSYSLKSTSPCIDKGTPASSGFIFPLYDIDGNPRIYGSRIDIGAFEYTVVGLNGENTPSVLELKQNYPNPFNPSTTIVFTLPNSGYAELSIYNIKGEQVKTMVKGVCQAGTQQLTFDGSAFASGMYYYRLTTPSQSIAKKMILLK